MGASICRQEMFADIVDGGASHDLGLVGTEGDDQGDVIEDVINAPPEEQADVPPADAPVDVMVRPLPDNVGPEVPPPPPAPEGVMFV
jgi:hypothetical protein